MYVRNYVNPAYAVLPETAQSTTSSHPDLLSPKLEAV